MTPKQQRFVEEYLVDLNGTQAAIRAGYSPESAHVEASRLLRNAKVAQAVAEARQEASERTQLSQDWVLGNLATIARRCMQSVPVLDKKGNVVLCETDDGELLPAYTFNAMGATQALSLIGKHLGLFNEKVDVRLVVEQLKEQIKDLDDSSLLALASASAGSDQGRAIQARPN